MAGRQYVIGSAFPSSGAPVFATSGMVTAIVPMEGRTILRGSGVLAFPTSVNPNLFGGANFLFVVAP